MAESKARTGFFSRVKAAPEPPEPEVPAQDEPRRDPAACIVDAGIYVDGRRTTTPKTFDEAFRALKDTPEGFAWLGLHRPGTDEMGILAKEFELNELAVEDTIIAHQRPKLERYDDTLFMVLRAARYVDQAEEVRFGEIHAFVGERFVITVRHSHSPNLARLRQELEDEPEQLALGPSVVLMRLLDIVVDEYMPVVYGIDNDIDEIDAQVFMGQADVSKRIYQLTREVIDFQRAVRPVGAVISAMRHDRVFYRADDTMRQQLRDIEDHVTSVNERVDAMREALAGVLNLHLSLQSQASNEQMQRMSEASLKQAEDARRIAAWAGVFFVPSLVTGIYGMNFTNMPELGWAAGYPFALLLMVTSATIMWALFKHQRWL
ncbi:magnesium and cobalt transport protein CorA [uncultured Tessaracoccus sp.]|uniref:magnesium and cobalt transport protein CorA n=1 Tax=uncultured Tessaracoccus sp. TaxID=905023 RepID=UPI0025E4313C|nr:magnesium and cobalt transport protein CorA [uncultured Tessaracoccus sp.]